MTTHKQDKEQYYCPKIRVISFSSERGFEGSDPLKGQLENPKENAIPGTWE